MLLIVFLFLLNHSYSSGYIFNPVPMTMTSFIPFTMFTPVNICSQCKFFIPSDSEMNGLSSGKCKMFPKIDKEQVAVIDIDFLVTGEKKEKKTEYHYCSTARSFRSLCGEEGVKYILKGT